MRVILDFWNYDDILLNICNEIKFWLSLNEKSQLDQLDYISSVTRKVKELWIYYIDEENNTLKSIEKRILEMTKKSVLKKIQKELLEFEENFSYERLKKIKELLIIAVDLKIDNINRNLNLKDLENKIKKFSQKEYILSRLEEKMNKILDSPSILDIEYFEYDLHEAKIEGIDIWYIESIKDEVIKKLSIQTG